MGSFGMDWNQKSSLLWDWENLVPFGTNVNETPKNALHPAPRGGVVGAAVNGSVHSSGGTTTVSSSSELGYGSSKSSISASIDSSSKAGSSRIEFNFAAVKGLDKNLGKSGELGRVEDTGTSPSSMMEGFRGEPLIGLKLGKRTYFEDVYGGNNVKSSPPLGSVAPSASALVKKTRVSQQNMQNAYCQVEGCKVDLSAAKDYHRKHKVCEAHSKSPKVIVAGQERRFCQQCSRFHGLAEFDQKKRSCRRRLSDHNARRRKPQPETISFSSSRLSTLFYDARQQTNLLFGQGSYGQVRSNASSSWDNSGGFKFTEAKASWTKPTKAAGLDGLHFPSPEISNNILAQHHDIDGLLPFKGTNAKVLSQGVEASGVASNSNGAPDLRRALSLLSTDSWGSADLQPSSHVHPGFTALASMSHPPMHALNLAPGFWQDEPPLDQQPRILAFDNLSNGAQVHEFQLPKASFGNAPEYGQMH